MAILTFAANHEQFTELEAAALWELELADARRQALPEPEIDRIQSNVTFCLNRMDELGVPNFAGNHALAWGWRDTTLPYRQSFSDWMDSGNYHIYDTSVHREASSH